MDGDSGGRRRMCQTVAVALLLCSLVLCFSLWGLGKKVSKQEGFSEVAVKEGRNGSILFNGEKLNFQSGSASAAATGHGLLHVDLHQSGNTAKYTSKLKNDTANEAAWRQLNASLHCGDKEMKLKATGPGAAEIQLHIDNVSLLPLKKVPESCGFSMQQNALGLVLIVPYIGCSVLTESGRYVLPMIWRGTAVKFICPIANPDASPVSTIPEPVQQPRKVSFSLRPWHFRRSKRQAKRPFSVYYPNSYNAYLYNYYMHMMALEAAKTKPTTTKYPQAKPPAYSYPLYYPYNSYYPYYSYHFLPNSPAMTTVPPATTTVRPIGNKNPPQSPADYAYFPYMPYLPPGQQLQIIPEKTQVYYYPNTEFIYGKPPYQHKPNLPMQPTWSQFTEVALPSDPAPPIKLSNQSPMSPTTSSASTAQKPISYNPYLDTGGPYVPFDKLPFRPYVVYKSIKLPDDQAGYMAKAGFKSGFQGQPGFPWQTALRFPQFTGQEHL